MSAEYRTMVNAARDLANSFTRFERDFARFRRIVAETEDKDQVMVAVLEACNTPERRLAIETINERLRGLGIEG